MYSQKFSHNFSVVPHKRLRKTEKQDLVLIPEIPEIPKTSLVEVKTVSTQEFVQN